MSGRARSATIVVERIFAVNQLLLGLLTALSLTLSSLAHAQYVTTPVTPAAQAVPATPAVPASPAVAPSPANQDMAAPKADKPAKHKGQKQKHKAKKHKKAKKH